MKYYIYNNKINKKELFNVFDLLKTKSSKNFVESIDVSVNLLLNYKNIKYTINSSLIFPYSVKKKAKKKILVFTDSPNFKLAYSSGAYYVGNEELIDKVKKNKIKYDIVICTPNVINLVNKIKFILGPKGLIPNIKFNTITNDLKKSITEFIKGKLIYKSDKFGIVNISIGNINFSNEELFLNLCYLLNDIFINKPINIKSIFFIKNIFVSSTMGISYLINLNN